jgi:hypothetical protein
MAKNSSKSGRKPAPVKRRKTKRAGTTGSQRPPAVAKKSRVDTVAGHPSDNIAHQVHGVLKTLLGQALKYIEGRGGNIASLPKDTSSDRQDESTNVDELPSLKSVMPSGPVSKSEDFAPALDGSGPADTEPEGDTLFGFSQFAVDQDEELARARSVVAVLRQESRMARAIYTSLFYLEELGDKKAFDGVVVKMSELSGGNKETTRDRISDLYYKKVVAKKAKVTRFEGITLTPLGKKAYKLLRLPESGVTAIHIGTPSRGT